MAAAAEPFLLTVEQYRQLQRREDVVQELHWGLVVALTFPKKKHTKMQSRLLELLNPFAHHKGLEAVELPFRAVPQYDLRAADVAFVSQQRWDATAEDDNLHGAPELVIEVLSPSNSTAEMREKAALCLANGAEEFLACKSGAKCRDRHASRRGHHPYEAEQTIPLPMLACEISVAQVFS